MSAAMFALAAEAAAITGAAAALAVAEGLGAAGGVGAAATAAASLEGEPWFQTATPIVAPMAAMSPAPIHSVRGFMRDDAVEGVWSAERIFSSLSWAAGRGVEPTSEGGADTLAGRESWGAVTSFSSCFVSLRRLGCAAQGGFGVAPDCRVAPMRAPRMFAAICNDHNPGGTP